VEFELDARNLKHFLTDHPERGIDEALLREVVGNLPRAQENDPLEGRTATHRIVGPDRRGRFWTFPSNHVGGEKWRPITGWPSTNTEITKYEEADD
jgi:hypothetical protein